MGVTPGMVAEDIRTVAEKIGHWPTASDYRVHGAFTSDTARRHLGIERDATQPNSWVYVLEDAFGDTNTAEDER